MVRLRFFNVLFVYFLCINSISGQTSLHFDCLNKQIELYKEDKGALQSLVVKNSGDLIITIPIDKESDPYHFKDYYQGERNFAIIGGRYKFYIFNVCSNKLIGPFYPCCRVESADAQTGVLNAYKIILDGQYLLVNAMDNGLTCFSLLDLCNPAEVDFYKSDKIYFKGKYVFIDKRKDNLFNGFSADCGNYKTEIDYEILFLGYTFELDTLGNLKYQVANNNNLILKHVVTDSVTNNLIIDLEKGVVNEEE